MISSVAGVEVGLIDDVFVGKTIWLIVHACMYDIHIWCMRVVNPTRQQMQNSTLKLTLAGTRSGILMIEGEADFLTEEVGDDKHACM